MTAMPETTIEVLENGPYLVRGSFVVLGPDGRPLPGKKERVVALCRCGASGSKPFCDGSHSRIGFRGELNPPADEDASG